MYDKYVKLRDEKGVKDATVARETGVGKSTFTDWKNGRSAPKGEKLQKIASYFGVPIEYFYGEEDVNASHETQLQLLFESQLKLDGWKVKHTYPAEGKPCDKCPRLQTDWWSNENSDGTCPGQLCDECVLQDAICMISKGDQHIVLSEEEYSALVKQNQTETIRAMLSNNMTERKSANQIPIVRRVAAGTPLDSIDEVIGYEEITDHMAKTGTYFGLKVNGDSMTPNIADGDIIICRQQPDAEDGQIVVALINGNDGVCKRLKKYQDGTIALISDNSAYPPLYFSMAELDDIPVRIMGIVKELRRKL